MASGKFGSADLVAVTETALFTVPPGYMRTCNIRMVNRGNQTAKVRIAIGATPPVAADWFDYDADLPPGGALDETAVVVGPNETVTVWSSLASVSVRAHGMERAV